MNKERVIIFDTTLRDGEQSPGCRMDVVAKLLIAKQLEKLGVDVIEAGFAISSKGDFDAVSQIARAIKIPQVCSLARTRQEDIEAAARALEGATNPRIHVFVATSDVHMEKKLHKSPAQILEMVATKVALAKSLIGNNIEFSPEDAARTGIDFLRQVVHTAIEAGATTINIPDTVGYAVIGEYPYMIGEMVTLAKSIREDIIISVHCHNDLGLAVANSLAGINAGARQVECTVMGIGERAGNAQLEAVVMALKTRQKTFGVDIGINTKQLYLTARLVSSVIGKPISDTLPVIGGNAFAHGAGIHQHGMKADHNTYEIMNATDVGWNGEATPLTKHSGRAALESRLDALGYIGKVQTVMGVLWPKFKALADQKTYIFNEDLYLLMQECMDQEMSDKKLFKIERVDYFSYDNTRSAMVTLSLGNRKLTASGEGDGAISSVADAIRNACSLMLFGVRNFRDEISWGGYRVLQSVGGDEAMGMVTIQVRGHDGIGYGRGSDTDVVVASAKAMVSAINHLLNNPVKNDGG